MEWTKNYLLVDDKVNSFTSRKDVVLQRDGTVVGVDHVTWLLVQVADPFGELPRVWDRRRKEDKVNIIDRKSVV